MNDPIAGREVELKLALPHGEVRRAGAHPLLRGPARAVNRRLHTVYFDTPALDLRRNGVALRIRRDGGRWVQTLKGEGSVRAGLHQREELELDVPGPQPEFTRLGAGALAQALASAHVRAQLRPVFVTDFVRSRRLLEPAPGVVVEAALDSGEIKGGGRREAVAELELELKSGEPWRLYEFALKLLGDIPLAMENRSKAERGFALARGEHEAPVKARPAALAADMTVIDAFKAVIWAGLWHLQANERGMLAGSDPEYLHQMRVAVRRLRSALGVFAPLLPGETMNAVAAELKWLGGALGPARDWDVFVTETLPPVTEEFGEHAALGAFAQRCGAPRRAAARKARRVVGSRRYQALLLGLARWLSAEAWDGELDEQARSGLAAPVREFAASVLEARYARARKRGRKLARLSPAELHRLRIAIKKFRYAADFFSCLFEGRCARETLKRLSRLQDILGAINDAATVGNFVRDVLHGIAGRHAAEAQGILLGWSRGQAATLRRELVPAWKAFRAAEKFW